MNELRLFYLGRELKNGGRSLENLGVGSHAVNVIHVHLSKSAFATWKSSSTESSTQAAPARAMLAPVAAVARFMQPPAASSSAVASAVPMRMAGFNSGPLGSGSFSSFLRRAQRQQPALGGNEVIEIDDDDDDDNDEVRIDGQPRVDGANVLTGLRGAIAPPQNQEVVDIDDDDDDNDDDDDDEEYDEDDVEDEDENDDDCVVVVPAPAAKRPRHT